MRLPETGLFGLFTLLKIILTASPIFDSQKLLGKKRFEGFQKTGNAGLYFVKRSIDGATFLILILFLILHRN